MCLSKVSLRVCHTVRRKILRVQRDLQYGNSCSNHILITGSSNFLVMTQEPTSLSHYAMPSKMFWTHFVVLHMYSLNLWKVLNWYRLHRTSLKRCSLFCESLMNSNNIKSHNFCQLRFHNVFPTEYTHVLKLCHSVYHIYFSAYIFIGFNVGLLDPFF
jgi:hypothetical protein